MTNEQLLVISQMATELYNSRLDVDALKSLRNDEEAKRIAAEARLKSDEYECNRIREREADILNVNEDLKKRCSDLMAERDDARRKLGALVTCVGFDNLYDTSKPKKALERMRIDVKKCIEDNNIVLTEGGMAK